MSIIYGQRLRVPIHEEIRAKVAPHSLQHIRGERILIDIELLVRFLHGDRSKVCAA